MKNKSFLKSSIVVIFLAIIVKIFGLIKEMIFAYIFGVNMLSDAFSLTQSIINMIYLIISTYIISSVPTIYVRCKEEGKTTNANLFLSNILNIILFVCIITGVLLSVFSSHIIEFMAPDYNISQLKLNSFMLKSTSLSLLFLSVSYLFSSYLNINNEYNIPQVMTLPGTLIFGIICLLLGKKHGLSALIMGQLLFSLFQVLTQLPFVLKTFKYKFVLNFNDPLLKKSIILALPSIIAIVIGNVSLIINKVLGTQMGIGAIASFDYANKLINLIIGVLILPIETILYSEVSNQLAKNQKKTVSKKINQGIEMINIILIPAVFLVLLVAESIISIIYQRGSFDTHATLNTALALRGLIIGMIPLSIFNVLSKVSYSLQKTSYSMISGTLGIVCNIITCLLLYKKYSLLALALGTSIGYLTSALTLFYLLKKYYNFINLKNSMIEILKMCIAATVAVYAAYKGLQNFPQTSNIRIVLIACIIGLLVYIFCAILLNINLMKKGTSYIINQIKRKNK